jgi:hypothetical protein
MAGKKDIVEQALKLVMGGAEKAAPKVAYHATQEPFENYDWSRLGQTTKDNTSGTSVDDWALSLAKLGPWSHEKPLSKKIGMKTDLPVMLTGKEKEFKSLDHLAKAISQYGGPEALRGKLVSKGYGHVSVNDEEFGGKSYVGLSPEYFSINKNAGGRTGYGPGGAIDDIVKMAGKIVSGADEPAKTGMVRGTFPGSKMPSVDALSRNVDKFVYHSGTAKDIPEMKYGVSPQIGPWVREVLEGSADDDAIDEIMENAVPVSWWSKEPSWAVVKVARELGKPIDQVTPEDLASYGHVALIPKKDPEAESLYWVGKEGLNMGPYSDVEDITGRKVKAYDADLYSGNYGPEGVERNEYITTKTVEPYLHLTGNELVDFLRKTGQYKKASGGRAGYGGGGSADNNSVSGALNVARGLQGGM